MAAASLAPAAGEDIVDNLRTRLAAPRRRWRRGAAPLFRMRLQLCLHLRLRLGRLIAIAVVAAAHRRLCPYPRRLHRLLRRG